MYDPLEVEPLVVSGGAELAKELEASAKTPERYLLEPWLPGESIVMVHSWRGVGKTHFAMEVAWAVATGQPFLKWNAPQARSVLYLDGEMSQRTFLRRVRRLSESSAIPVTDTRLEFIPRCKQKYRSMPDLSTKEAQTELIQYLSGVDLLVIDNVSTLVRDDITAWFDLQQWLLTLRARGMSVLLVHHDNKKGGQLGMSQREHVLDETIHLKRPEGYTPEDGAMFEIHFTKSRDRFGSDVSPLLACLPSPGVLAPRGRQWWVWWPLNKGTVGGSRRQQVDDKIVLLHGQGLTQKEIAERLTADGHKVSQSTVSRVIKRLGDSGAGSRQSTRVRLVPRKPKLYAIHSSPKRAAA
jgi:KaiC/GvpD/RAD55 family RecA-like ATPase